MIERNWRYRHLEIDIISIDNDGIHFVEVKTRRPPMQADPQESVDWKKRVRITEAAKGYMRQKGTDAECHFDIVSVIFEKGRTVVRMFPDAYFPGL